MNTKQANWAEIKSDGLAWVKPSIRPLFKLGEQTTPTTYSASSPEKHKSDISELRPRGE